MEAEAEHELDQHASGQVGLLGRVIAALVADPRVAAAWLSGSFGRGEGDMWADLDLHIAIFDEHFESYLAERPQLYMQVGQPLLIQAEMPSNAVNGGRLQLVVYSGCHEIDWNIGPLSQAERWPASRMLIERVPIPIATPPALTPDERLVKADHWLTFFWAMAPIAVKYVGRSDTRRAVSQLDLMTTAYIALWRLVTFPDGPDPWQPATNRPLEPELDARIPRVGVSIDAQSALDVIRALCAQVEELHLALAALGAAIPDAMPAEVERQSRLAESVIQQREQPSNGTQARRADYSCW
jgi:hypothetical protein